MRKAAGKRPSNYRPPFDLERAVDAMRLRLRLAQIKPLFAQAGLSIGTGFKSLLEKIGEGGHEGDALAEKLVNVYKDQLILGPRSVLVLQRDGFDYRALARGLLSLRPGDSPFSHAYPLPLTSPQLRATPQEGPVLVEVRALTEGAVALIFSSVRTFDDREEKRPADFTGQQRAILGDFERLVVINSFYYQAYDVLIVRPGLDLVEVRVDAVRDTSSEHAHQTANALLLLLSHVHAQVADLATGYVNFFPAIKSMYVDALAGKIEKLWFQTDTGSIKKELMSERGADLRREPYHVSGVTALLNGETVLQNQLQPFLIKTNWENLTEIQNEVGLTLPGKYKDIHSPIKILQHALVENCSNDREFLVIINRLLSHCQTT